MMVSSPSLVLIMVKFYATDGKYLGSSVAANGAASYAVNESLVIAKVGKDSINNTALN